jgi:hypothetical protein
MSYAPKRSPLGQAPRRVSPPVADICYEILHQNVCSLNRHVRTEKSVTPSRFRQQFLGRGEGAPASPPQNRSRALGGGRSRERAVRGASPLD